LLLYLLHPLDLIYEIKGNDHTGISYIYMFVCIYILANKKIFIFDDNKIRNGISQNLNNVQMTKLNSYFILST